MQRKDQRQLKLPQPGQFFRRTYQLLGLDSRVRDFPISAFQKECNAEDVIVEPRNPHLTFGEARLRESHALVGEEENESGGRDERGARFHQGDL